MFSQITKNSGRVRKFLILFLFLLAASCWQRQEERVRQEPLDAPAGKINVIPQPASIERGDGEFYLSPETKIVAVSETERRAADVLNRILSENGRLTLNITAQTDISNAVFFNNADEPPDAEEYGLTIKPEFIRISGSERGMFYAVQTLRQIMPLEFPGRVKIPAASITDAPRFAYRGMHLDVARHFMPVEFVKKYIDLISRYKFNYFHWHLTDDQGWRVEIKKYPRLTEIGSKRRETVLGKNYRPYIGDRVPVEGFYTQEQIREIVEFAESRYVTVIPEIDLPGHSSAALAAYPQHGCKKDYRYEVKTTWGGFPDVYCPTDEAFAFIEGMLDEVIGMFPNSPYIHIGGDEVMPDHWRESDFVREFKKRENLKTEKDVESYFVRRIESFVNSRGKKIIGWDDILSENIGSSATIMSWRESKYAAQAVRSGHRVIMTPADFTYFDAPQASETPEPLSLGGTITLEDVYEFEPVPTELNDEQAKYIYGVQGCVWTEFIKKPSNVEYMAFPRALALAETAWSKPENKNFADFTKRLKNELSALDKANVNYRIPKPHGLNDRALAKNEAAVDLDTPVHGGEIYYTLDGKNPGKNSEIYRAPFTINVRPNEIVELKTKIITSNGRESSVFTAKYTGRNAR